jgi:methylmalonyl-CoA/ethylmalonyl-CoA epimerase
VVAKRPTYPGILAGLDEERREVLDAVLENLRGDPPAASLAVCLGLLSHVARSARGISLTSCMLDPERDMGPATPSSRVALSAIGQIAITVTGIDRAIGFYRDVLGLPFLFQAPNLGFFDCSGVRLMLSGGAESAGHSSTVIYFRMPDIQQAFQELTARDVTFERDPHLVARLPDHDLWMAFFRDPDGNLLALMSEVPRL